MSTQNEHPEDSQELVGSFGVWMIASERPTSQNPLRQRLSVFSKPADRFAIDEEVKSILEGLGMSRVQERTPFGEFLMDDSRLLTRHLSKTASLYAVPTSKDWLCLIATGDLASAHCFKDVTPAGIAAAIHYHDGRLLIYGIAVNEVQRVRIEFAEPETARVSGNVFVFSRRIASRELGKLRHLTIMREDGSEARLDLDLVGTPT